MPNLPDDVQWSFTVTVKKDGALEGRIESREPISSYEVARHLTLISGFYFKEAPIRIEPGKETG